MYKCILPTKAIITETESICPIMFSTYCYNWTAKYLNICGPSARMTLVVVGTVVDSKMRELQTAAHTHAYTHKQGEDGLACACVQSN